MESDSETVLLGLICGTAVFVTATWRAILVAPRNARLRRGVAIAVGTAVCLSGLSLAIEPTGGTPNSIKLERTRSIERHHPMAPAPQSGPAVSAGASEPDRRTGRLSARPKRSVGDRMARDITVDIPDLWKDLTADQQHAWRVWARENDVVAEDGQVERMNVNRAFRTVLQRRAIAGEPLDPATTPAPADWLDGALSLRDAGPFTTNDGYIGFRAEQDIGVATGWFVWATPPADLAESDPERLMCFIRFFRAEPMQVDDITVNLGTDYGSVWGSWDGPGNDGEWPTEKVIWFRLHQYCGGQLGPGVLLRGRIQVEL